MDLNILRTAVTDYVRAPASKISADQVDAALRLALARFSVDRPRAVCQDVISDGSAELSLPDNWDVESDLLGLEYPIGCFPQALLRRDTFGLVQGPAGQTIRVAELLNAGESVRVFYSLPHVLTDAVCTIQDKDAEAFASWAAAVLCDQIAGTYASNSAPSIQADSADTSNPAREWRTRANGFRARYAALTGVQGVTGQSSDKPAPKAAGTVVEFDLQESRGYGWLDRYRR